jgi:hypothetical protein
VIGSDQVAVVIEANGAWKIVLPREQNTTLPEQAKALIAAAMRLTSDAAFYKEMLEWFAAQHGQQGLQTRDDDRT